MNKFLCAVFLALLAGGVQAELAWKEVHGAKVPVPPAVHPRLYLRAEHVPALKARREHPVLAPVIKEISNATKRRPDFKLELNAVEYLVNGDRELGRQTVQDTLAFLKKAELPDRNDACRATGRNMVTGAIVYDWLYPLLTAEEKQAFIKELIRLARTMECRYPPTRQGSVTGHASEAQVMRDMLCAGIAIYDEYPDMYDHAAARFFREHLPVRNWLYDGHAYHQGDSYGPYRFAWDCFPLWIFDRLGAGNVYNPEQAQVPYLWIYKTRPDGQRMRAGDTFMHSTNYGQPWGVGAGAMLTASYYGDGYLLSHYLAQQGNRDNELIFEFLWRDLELQPEPIKELPRTRYYGTPFGWMTARTGWDENSAMVEMKVNEYNFNNHQHLDAGAFQIYYRGALAIDSGVYTGSSGRYGSPHCCNYYWRTIAHNTLLIYDPNEEFNTEKDYGNDGGQRLPNGRNEPHKLETMLDPSNGYRTGTVLTHGFGPDPKRPAYSLLQGDITAAYSDKVQKVVRSSVFLNLEETRTPAALIVFDRVISRDPSFKKYWLLHSEEEPQIKDSQIVIDNRRHGQTGRLFLKPLLPVSSNRVDRKVGGPGKEFMVFGTNYANDQTQRHIEKSSMELGAWRVEISPESASAEDLFLNVMQITDQSNDNPYPVECFSTGAMTGCRIDTPQQDWVVLFRKDAALSSDAVNLTLVGKDLFHLLITGLEPGQWQAKHANGIVKIFSVTAESCCGWLELPSGEWRIEMKTE